ncbi:hypothetical protein KN10_0700 [Anoxybacillus flavithermus NBRC 109594]|uniref:Uncharacterized protein n=1 Tax=Anoxybacillus flavithermus NBRC 109594 TaxID=1315967 RepID=R4G016_9BACL|nr:hypothetical protein KN10_0700 [Anoxybacillus flavithermus NBRC 109594]
MVIINIYTSIIPNLTEKENDCTYAQSLLRFDQRCTDKKR